MRCLAWLSALSIAVLLTWQSTGVVRAEGPSRRTILASRQRSSRCSPIPALQRRSMASRRMTRRTLQDQIRITEIPAPPFMESARANYFAKRLREFGLTDAAIDAEGNVVALRKGSVGRPKVVLSAHLDTVFPEGTDVTVREWADAYYAPGIGDNSAGLP